ncbi:MAG TPA: hypothetical protein VEL07_16705 [Planctomycetota bacterium]|nr:hypothetical protein [Planctomycetota bacterium]
MALPHRIIRHLDEVWLVEGLEDEVDIPFATADEAVAWCREHGFEPEVDAEDDLHAGHARDGARDVMPDVERDPSPR